MLWPTLAAICTCQSVSWNKGKGGGSGRHAMEGEVGCENGIHLLS